ncbi:polyprenyl synthetase family protein [Methanocella sp. MCL-LM]|uniref:polyprenyl synthetase family protein n=1 Tax=Methanocella sp. MCL-LM TaxID=3412035 RepID=UPI003C7250A3
MVIPVTAILESYSVYTNQEIKRILDSRKKVGLLGDMMMYHLGWRDEQLNPCESKGGKQLRSTMCLLACEAVCGKFDNALPGAAAVELVHNFSLIHDDIEDGDEKRRHRPTVWKLWGVPQAINTGDAMDVVSYMAILELKVKPETMIPVLKVFNDTIMQLCEGQYLDMDFQTRKTVTVEEYIEMITGKTAALIEASTAIGAMAATDDQKVIGHFKSFGHKIGIGFQIQDDLLGIWGDPALTGKSARNDIRNKKKTLPVLYALQYSKDREEMKQLYAKEHFSEADIDRVFQILTEAGAYEYTMKTAHRYRDEALAELEGLCPGSKAMEDLVAIGRFLVDRDY